MSGIWLALLVFLVAGGFATAWILGLRLRREEQATGLMALSGMHWREFQRLVLAMMEARGYRRAEHPGEGASDALIELEQDGQAWLLSTKHGAGYVPGPSAISEFANALQLRGAAGGWMTTLGALAPEHVSLARVQKIELLDGQTLWSEIKPLLEPAQREEITGVVRKRANHHLVLAWAAAAVAAFAVTMLPGSDPEPRTPTARAAATPAASAAAGTPSGSTAPATPGAAAESDTVPEDPAALALRRRRVAEAIGTLSWVDRALWSTQSTLVVHLIEGTQPDKSELCGLVEPYAELRASRLQLQPPTGSEQAVRFIQCRTY